MNAGPVFGTLSKIALGSCALPNNFIDKVGLSKHRIQKNLKVMARGRIAVQIKRPRGLQHAVQLQKPHGHHREICHHVVFLQKRPHRPQHFRRVGIARLHHLVKSLLGRLVSVPAIAKGFDLRLALVPVRRLEKHIIIRVGIERRIEIDEIDALVFDVLAQNGKVVAIKKRVAGGCL